LPPETFPGLKISIKCVCGRDCAPDPTGELTALHRPLAELERRVKGMREGKGKEGRGGKV